MMKKKAMLASMMILASVGVSACGTGSSSQTGSNGEPTLVVVNWKGYGSDDPKVVKQFEDTYHVKIVHEYMASEQELLTKMRTEAGKIDIVLPNASILPVAEKDGLLAPIDTSKLQNYQFISNKFKNLPENSMDGKVYAVPWVWGSTAIAYNPQVIHDKIDSVQAFWNPNYKGKIAFRDDFNDAIMTAAIALGQNPNHPSDLNAIKQKLIEQKPLDSTFWQTGDEFSKLYATNQVSLGLMWSGQSASMKKNGVSINYVIPKEGAIGWVDNWAVAKGTKNSDLALKFIDFMTSKEFESNWVNNGGPAPTNTQATATLDPKFVKEMGLDDSTLSRLYFISYHSDAEQKQWNELWQEVKTN
jgi:spermidine/putrescine transport system substrate-binding protein